MKTILFLSLATLTIISCGKVEKRPSPFATISNEQQGGGKGPKETTEVDFRQTCVKRGGEVLSNDKLKPDEKMCMVATTFFSRTQEQLEKDFENGLPKKVYRDLGKAQFAHYVMVDVSPKTITASIKVFSGNTFMGQVVNGRLPYTEVVPGEITVEVDRSINYQRIEAVKVRCYTRNRDWIHCQ